jgi:hypothetical protein
MPRASAFFAARLHDQVRVIALQRVVRDAEVAAFAGLGERAPELAHHGDRAQRRQVGPNAQRHVDGGAGARSRCSTRDRRPRGRPAPGRGPPRPLRLRLVPCARSIEPVRAW